MKEHLEEKVSMQSPGLCIAFKTLCYSFSEFITGPEEFDPSGIKDYVKECNRLGVIPCSYFSRHVHDANFCMRNHGLGPLGAKAIAKPLEVSVEDQFLICAECKFGVSLLILFKLQVQ